MDSGGEVDMCGEVRWTVVAKWCGGEVQSYRKGFVGLLSLQIQNKCTGCHCNIFISGFRCV